MRQEYREGRDGDLNHVSGPRWLNVACVLLLTNSVALGKALTSLKFHDLRCAMVMIAPTTSFKVLWEDVNEMLEVASRVDGEELGVCSPLRLWQGRVVWFVQVEARTCCQQSPAETPP